MTRQLNKIKKIESLPTKIDSILEYAFFLRRRDPVTALALCKQALDLCDGYQIPGISLCRSRANATMALLHAADQDPAIAMEHASAAILHASGNEIKPPQSDVQMALATVALNANLPNVALGHAVDAAKIAQLVKDTDRASIAASLAGHANACLGKYEEANRQFSIANSTTETPLNPETQMVINTHHAKALLLIGNISMAARKCVAAYNFARKNAYKAETHTNAALLIEILQVKGRPRHALRFFAKFIQTSLPSAENTVTFTTYLAAAKAAMAAQDPAKALEFTQQAERSSVLSGNEYNIALASRLAAEAANDLGDKELAFEYLTRAVAAQASFATQAERLAVDLGQLKTTPATQLLQPATDVLGTESMAPERTQGVPKKLRPQFKTIVIVDKDEIYLTGLKQRLAELGVEQVIATTCTADAALAVERLHPDILVTDWISTGDSTIEFLRTVRYRSESQLIAINASETTPEILAEASTVNVNGFFRHCSNFSEFMDKVNRTYSGREHLDHLAIRRLVKESEISHDVTGTHHLLTNRQKAIADLLIKGYLYRNMAEMMHVSERTIKRETKEMMQQLGMRNRKTLETFLRRNVAVAA